MWFKFSISVARIVVSSKYVLVYSFWSTKIRSSDDINLTKLTYLWDTKLVG